MDAVAPAPAIEHGPNLRQRLAARGFDAVTLLVVPAAIFTLLLFVYPFAFGFVLSFEPKAGGDWLANYRRFFSDPFLYNTIANTLWLAIPVTLVNLLLAVPIAFRVRLMRRQRLLTTILVLPITLGTVLVAEGLLNYLGPQGWFNRTLLTFGLISQPVKLVHNYWGVFASLVITGFPFTFLLTLSYVTRHRSGARAGGRHARRQCVAALPPYLPAAAGAGLCHHLLPVLRAGLLGLPVRGAARRARRRHPRHLDCGGYGGFRAIRLLHGLGDRDDHGLRPARHRAWRCSPSASCSTAAPASGGEGRADDPRYHTRLQALGCGHLGDRGLLRHQPVLAMIATVVDELVRHALARHLAAGGLHHALVFRRPGTSSSSGTS